MKTFLVLSNLTYKGKDYKRYDLAELPKEKAGAFVNKVMPVKFTPDEPMVFETSNIDSSRPLAKFLRLEKEWAREEAGQFINPNWPSSLKTLESDEHTTRHELAVVDEKEGDSLHTSQSLKIDAERAELHKRLAAIKTTHANVQARLDGAISEWQQRKANIMTLEHSLDGWHETPVWERSQDTTEADAIDGLVLDYLAYKKSVANASKFFRPHFERRMQECKKQLDEALQKHERI